LATARPENERELDSHLPLEPADPPSCPEGWHAGPPDFVGVGAQRCGTTWWHRVVCAHPGVCFEPRIHAKEIHFFDTLGDRSGLSPADIERYQRYFPRPPGGLLTGEWTPRYMQDPWVPGQLTQAAPDVRVLMLLRDPVDRFASGFERGRRLAAERGVTGIDAELTARHIALGMYADKVQRILEAFGRERVLILQYESCRERYADELRRTFGFLGLDSDQGPSAQLPREPRERPLPEGERERLGEVFAPDVERLQGVLPEFDFSLWPSAIRR
jgi:sulfotransferase family protein